MNRILVAFFSIVSSSLLFFGCTRKAESARSGEVVVYTYDSFAGDWGPASKLAELFKKKTGLTVTFVDCGDAVQAMSRAIIEKDNPNADVIIGIDNNTSSQAADAGILSEYSPKGIDSIDIALRSLLGAEKKLVPYDWSHFALIFDTRSSVPEPKSLRDLTDEAYKGKIILMDPETSTPGLGFVAWTRAVFGDGDAFTDFWTKLKPNILTMASGWSAGYGLFTSGEAPLVISYTTSPAANLEYDGIDYYKALVFDEGHYMQVEGAGILNGAQNRKGAELFMDFLISEEAQAVLPLTQWMYPVNGNVVLPDCYKKAAAVPGKTLSVDSASVKDAVSDMFAAIRK